MFYCLVQDECSFVSLRDVDRSLTVTSWFLQQAERSHVLFDLLDEKLQPQIDEEYEDEETEDCGQHEEEEEVKISGFALLVAF